MTVEAKSRAELEAACRTGKVLVDFWATWCMPCRMMGEAIASELVPAHPEITVVKVNVDEVPELAAAFGVMSIPALFCFVDGRKVREFVGVQQVRDLVAAFA